MTLLKNTGVKLLCFDPNTSAHPILAPRRSCQEDTPKLDRIQMKASERIPFDAGAYVPTLWQRAIMAAACYLLDCTYPF